MAEGIIFGGYLLSEEQFTPIFKEWYLQRKQEFKTALQVQILDVIDRMVYQSSYISRSTGAIKSKVAKIKGQYDAKALYMAWENLTTEYFGNGSVSIIAGAKFGEKEYKWTKIIDEKKVVNDKGIYIQKKGLAELEEKMKDMNGIYAAAELQDLINSHFDNLVNALSTYNLSKEDAISLHQLMAYRKSKLNRPGFTGSTYNKIIFGGQSNAAGKQLDAYMNHIGNYHQQVFGLMTKGMIDAQSIASINANMTEDFSSMFATKRNETQNWLLDSLNTASWLTGGDIVVVNDTGAVIYNIQLKTTGKGKTFEVATTTLAKFAKDMLNLIDQDSSPDKLAALMFRQLKTTSANEIDNTEKFFKDKAYEFVEENLGLKKGTINIGIFNS